MLINCFTESNGKLMQTMPTDDPVLLQEAQSCIQINTVELDSYLTEIEFTLFSAEEHGYFDIIAANLPELGIHTGFLQKMPA